MSYIRTVLSGPGYRFVSNSHSFRSHKGKRGERRERTKEEMEKQNARNRAIHTQLLILGNFRNGWHVTLTYQKDKRPPDSEAAKKELRKFFAKCGRRYKKAGYEFKWLCVTEIGSKGAIHHHLIIEDIQDKDFSTQRVIRDCWPGGKYLSPMYEDGAYQSLSEYLTKKESKESVTGCKVTHSRNLAMPKTKRERRRGSRWLPEPKIPKGWQLVKETLHNGLNAFTGLPCQHYLLIEIEKGGANACKDIQSFFDTKHPPERGPSDLHTDNSNWRQRGYSL